MPHNRFTSLRNTHLESILSLISREVAASFDADSPLTSKIAYHLETGGKRLRALIPLRIAEIAGLPITPILPFAAACELLHNATLVHDDLQDGDLSRRGRDTVWAKFGAPSAINVGDAMLFATLRIASTLDLPHQTKADITSLIISYTLQVIDGQEREFLLLADPSLSWERYTRVVQGKTSGLFGLPIVGTATLLNLPKSLRDALTIASHHLGILFQMQDDLLDIYGEKGREESYADIREGKVSALIVHLLDALKTPEQTPQREWLVAMLRKPRASVTDSDITTTLELFHTYQTKQAILDRIQDEAQQATQPLQGTIWGSFVTELADLFCDPIKGL